MWPVFPFTAIVGQDKMKRALVLNAVSPEISDVLIRGEQGTAKSTAARALAALLPTIEVVERAARSSAHQASATAWPAASRYWPIYGSPAL